MLNCFGLRKNLYVQFKPDDSKTVLAYSLELFLRTWPQKHRYGRTVDLWLALWYDIHFMFNNPRLNTPSWMNTQWGQEREPLQSSFSKLMSFIVPLPKKMARVLQVLEYCGTSPGHFGQSARYYQDGFGWRSCPCYLARTPSHVHMLCWEPCWQCWRWEIACRVQWASDHLNLCTIWHSCCIWVEHCQNQ